MFSNSKSRHTYHRSSASVPLLSRHRRLFSLSLMGIGLCHTKSNSRKIYLIWFTIICYMIGAYVAYTVYFEGQTGGVRSDDQFRLQSSHMPKVENYGVPENPVKGGSSNSIFTGNTKRKRILFWTEFYKEYSLDSLCIRPDTLSTCPFSQCEFTLDKNLLTSSDAIIFHGRDLWGSNKFDGYTDSYIDMPKFRSENQLWIFLMFEAPVHTWINLEPFDNLFNMTMTYRPDSDIYIPYGRVTPIGETSGEKPHQNQFLTLTTGITRAAGRSNYSTKPLKNKRLVAWSVSNCYKTPSRRNEVVHELHKYIPIDIYGDCGSNNCTPKKDLCDSGLECHHYLADKYKFYLAFENSLCEDYITEKFYDSLYVGMVPVVYGYGDYSRVAPKGSYIDATVFPTMKSLADYLIYLDKHPLEYAKYFEWRKSHAIKVSYFQQGWCSLCTKLWTSSKGGSVTNSQDPSQYHQDPASASAPVSVPITGFNSEEVIRSEHAYLRGDTFIVKNLSDWWFHKSTSAGRGLSSAARKSDWSLPTSNNNEETVHLKENACMNPTQLKWDPNIFSFYGFIYYPNYSVKMGFIYALSIFGIIFLFYLLRSANVTKRMSKNY